MCKSSIFFRCQKECSPFLNSPWFSLQTPDTPSDTLIAGEAPLCTRHATVNISLMPRNACHRASKWPQGLLLLLLHLFANLQCTFSSQSMQRQEPKPFYWMTFTSSWLNFCCHRDSLFLNQVHRLTLKISDSEHWIRVRTVGLDINLTFLYSWTDRWYSKLLPILWGQTSNCKLNILELLWCWCT